MTEKPRIWFASLVAPLVMMIIPAILAGLTIIFERDDDAPIKASVFLLTILPVSYPIIVLSMAGIGHGLLSANKLNLKNLGNVSIVISIFISLLIGISSPFGMKDQIVGVCIFFTITQACSLLGVLCWWYLARKGLQKENTRD